MSSTHQFYSDWSPEYFAMLSKNIGSKTGEYIALLIEQQDYPETGYKQALGILSLKKAFDKQRIEKACAIALTHERCSYRTIKRILENNMDKAIEAPVQQIFIPIHMNLQGPEESELCNTCILDAFALFLQQIVFKILEISTKFKGKLFTFHECGQFFRQNNRSFS